MASLESTPVVSWTLSLASTTKSATSMPSLTADVPEMNGAGAVFANGGWKLTIDPNDSTLTLSNTSINTNDRRIDKDMPPVSIEVYHIVDEASQDDNPISAATSNGRTSLKAGCIRRFEPLIATRLDPWDLSIENKKTIEYEIPLPQVVSSRSSANGLSSTPQPSQRYRIVLRAGEEASVLLAPSQQQYRPQHQRHSTEALGNESATPKKEISASAHFIAKSLQHYRAMHTQKEPFDVKFFFANDPAKRRLYENSTFLAKASPVWAEWLSTPPVKLEQSSSFDKSTLEEAFDPPARSSQAPATTKPKVKRSRSVSPPLSLGSGPKRPRRQRFSPSLATSQDHSENTGADLVVVLPSQTKQAAASKSAQAIPPGSDGSAPGTSLRRFKITGPDYETYEAILCWLHTGWIQFRKPQNESSDQAEDSGFLEIPDLTETPFVKDGDEIEGPSAIPRDVLQLALQLSLDELVQIAREAYWSSVNYQTIAYELFEGDLVSCADSGLQEEFVRRAIKDWDRIKMSETMKKVGQKIESGELEDPAKMRLYIRLLQAGR